MTSPDYSIPQVRERIAVDSTVIGSERLSKTMLRLTFSSNAFVGQTAISCADTYMKLVLPDPQDPENSLMRSYTVRSHDPLAGTVEVDFALHGQGGVAAAWAEQAKIGDSALFKGIGGGYNPSVEAPWHLLIGDDSALPAIAAALDRLAPGSTAQVILVAHSKEELLGSAYDLDLSKVSILTVVDSTSAVLREMAFAFENNEGAPHVFLHGEAGMVREARRALRTEHEQAIKSMSVSGYWRAGASDEQWRMMKRDWSAAQEAEESQLLARGA